MHTTSTNQPIRAKPAKTHNTTQLQNGGMAEEGSVLARQTLLTSMQLFSNLLGKASAKPPAVTPVPVPPASTTPRTTSPSIKPQVSASTKQTAPIKRAHTPPITARASSTAARAPSATPRVSPMDLSNASLADRMKRVITTVLAVTDTDEDNQERRVCDLFLSKPSRQDYPDYYEVIKKPVFLDDIQERLRSGEYQSLEQLQTDFFQMVKNAQTYNERDSQIFGDACLIRRSFVKFCKLAESGSDPYVWLEKKQSLRRPQTHAPDSAQKPADTAQKPAGKEKEEQEEEEHEPNNSEIDGAAVSAAAALPQDRPLLSDWRAKQQCPLCGMMFVSRSNVTRHIHHLHGMKVSHIPVVTSRGLKVSESPYERAAVAVLSESGTQTAMHYRDICNTAIQRGLIAPASKTPQIAMNGTLLRSLQFYSARRGIFGLAQWLPVGAPRPERPEDASDGHNLSLSLYVCVSLCLFFIALAQQKNWQKKRMKRTQRPPAKCRKQSRVGNDRDSWSPAIRWCCLHCIALHSPHIRSLAVQSADSPGCAR
eukprot:m.361830 g.361830  ORF g.361830 m.361830 type:complete len:538 (+) comp56010_c0_seq19:142-1755(+)